MAQLHLLRPLVLATDLDGTFLAGEPAARRELYRLIDAHRATLTLIFVTGRGVASVQALLVEGDLPCPDHLIGDVGTTIVDGTFAPHVAVQGWVERQWNGANARVRALLASEPGLVLQDSLMERRVSYFYEADLLDPSLVSRLEGAGFTAVLSAGVYLDVLPQGVSKGPTLQRLVDSLGLDPDDVLVAGDTLNDLSLFETPFVGVVVGGAEKGLVEATQGRPNVFQATEPGAGGILEGLRAFGFVR